MKAGDKVTRILGGVVPMEMTISEVKDGIITCIGGWTFDEITGEEIDDDLEWGPKHGNTGSYLQLPKVAQHDFFMEGK